MFLSICIHERNATDSCGLWVTSLLSKTAKSAKKLHPQDWTSKLLHLVCNHSVNLFKYWFNCVLGFSNSQRSLWSSHWIPWLERNNVFWIDSNQRYDFPPIALEILWKLSLLFVQHYRISLINVSTSFSSFRFCIKTGQRISNQQCPIWFPWLARTISEHLFWNSSVDYLSVAWEYSISDFYLLKLIDILESEHMFLDLESKLTKYAPSGWKDDVRSYLFIKFQRLIYRFFLNRIYFHHNFHNHNCAYLLKT